MYTAHYGLREKPFRLTPDPRFLYLSSGHREALAHVLYGIDQGEGFIAVTGEVGTGKTTLCRTLVDRLERETELACLLHPALDPDELLSAIALELGLPPVVPAGAGSSRAALLDRLNAFMMDARTRGRKVLLIVDEAQCLSVEGLEQLRLLSNLETSRARLIQIVLFGQPELDVRLDSRPLRQLRQRIGVRWRLRELSEDEAAAYVLHRVRVATGDDHDLFTPGALRQIRRRSRGIPRLLNLLADRSLLVGYAAGAKRVNGDHVERAAREILSARSSARQAARRPGWRRVIPSRYKESS